MPEHNDPTQLFLESLPEIKKDQAFEFACHPKVPCFNACCGDLNLMLTPYDVLRLRRALSESSKDFIQNRAEVGMAPDTGFPVLTLRMLEHDKKPCPFVSDSGCTLYEHRPGACRTYPLGRATRMDKAGKVAERFFLVQEPHCLGFDEKTTWTPETWLKDQGLEAYNQFNDRYMGLMARQKDTGQKIQSGQTNMALLALYQLDSFLNFIRDMKVFDRLNLSKDRQQAILDNEEARLEFALDWLEVILFGKSENIEIKA